MKVDSKKFWLTPNYLPPAHHSSSAPFPKALSPRRPTLCTLFTTHSGLFCTAQQTHPQSQLEDFVPVTAGTAKETPQSTASKPASSCSVLQKEKSFWELRDPCELSKPLEKLFQSSTDSRTMMGCGVLNRRVTGFPQPNGSRVSTEWLEARVLYFKLTDIFVSDNFQMRDFYVHIIM